MFKSEEELVNSFNKMYIKFLMEIFDYKEESFLLNEYNSNNGIVDIVVGTFSKYKSLNKRQPINVNLISPLINFEMDCVIELEYFMNYYNISKQYARKCLNEYSDAGFFSKIDKNKYMKINNYEININNVVSIEAKLKNWSKALLQAYRYKRFSNMSFVLLDEQYSKPALKSITLFKNYNIGLITMTKQNYNIHFIPQENKPKDIINFMKLNEETVSYL